MEKKQARRVAERAEWAERQPSLNSTPGVGDTLTCTLLVELHELGTLNNREISALVGFAPINRDNGRLRGQRRNQGGRASICTVLYMSTLSTAQYNPVFKAFLSQAGCSGQAQDSSDHCMHAEIYFHPQHNGEKY